MGTDLPLVSVVVPCYNAAAWIAETLESAFSQDYSPLQVVVVDDGSTDDTRTVVSRFEDRLELLVGEHAGASRARNLGTEAARGHYLQYLDADDLLAPGSIAARVRALELSGADVAYSGWQRFRDGEAGRQLLDLVDRDIDEWGSDAELAVVSGFWAPPAALTYRREMVDAIGAWNERLPIVQDARFLFDAAHNGARFVRVAGVGGLHRVSVDSLSRNDHLAFIRDVYANAVEIEALWSRGSALTKPRKVGLAAVYDYLARTLLTQEPELFRDAVRRRRRLDPGARFTYGDAASMLARVVGQGGARWLLRLTGRSTCAPGH